MAYRPSKIQTLMDDPVHPARIQPSEVDTTTAPLVPAENDFYFKDDSDAVNCVLTLMYYKAGKWRTIITFSEPL